ncbi:hypothetical protein GTW08_07180 [Pseudonocardia sp. SID8383]|nr:hypothetical protein [Pseudonocardia sp. SID8383]
MDWRAGAACRGTDPELFFPTAVDGPALEREEQVALGVCARCPVLAQCREWAIAGQAHGVAAGLTESERIELRRSALPVRRPVTKGAVRGSWQRADGRSALAAGRDRGRIAVECGVSRRTVDRWAVDLTTTSPTIAPGGGA